MTTPEEVATSFDALAHEHNLSGRERDLCRVFFLFGLKKNMREGGRRWTDVPGERLVPLTPEQEQARRQGQDS